MNRLTHKYQKSIDIDPECLNWFPFKMRIHCKHDKQEKDPVPNKVSILFYVGVLKSDLTWMSLNAQTLQKAHIKTKSSNFCLGQNSSPLFKKLPQQETGWLMRCCELYFMISLLVSPIPYIVLFGTYHICICCTPPAASLYMFHFLCAALSKKKNVQWICVQCIGQWQSQCIFIPIVKSTIPQLPSCRLGPPVNHLSGLI